VCVKTLTSKLKEFRSDQSLPVPESLDRKYDSEPATGHQFFRLKHDFPISKYFNPFLTP
jgi:hypothetical protein